MTLTGTCTRKLVCWKVWRNKKNSGGTYSLLLAWQIAVFIHYLNFDLWLQNYVAINGDWIFLGQSNSAKITLSDSTQLSKLSLNLRENPTWDKFYFESVIALICLYVVSLSDFVQKWWLIASTFLIASPVDVSQEMKSIIIRMFKEDPIIQNFKDVKCQSGLLSEEGTLLLKYITD